MMPPRPNVSFTVKPVGLCKCGHEHLFADRCGGPVVCYTAQAQFPCYLGFSSGYPHEHACPCNTHELVVDFNEHLYSKDLAVCHYPIAWEKAKLIVLRRHSALVKLEKDIWYWLAVRETYMAVGGEYIDKLTPGGQRHYYPHTGCNGRP